MPASTTTSNVAKFWDKMAEGYSKSPIKDEAAYQKKLQITQQYLKPHMQVLEIGCGTGGTSLIHAPHVQHILATDISANMIAIAQRKQQEQADQTGNNVEFRQASVEQLEKEIPKASQDVVLGCSILHLVDNRDRTMASVHQWLKPGGLFVTSTVCLSEMGWFPKTVMRTLLPAGQFFGLLPTVNFLSKQDLKESFQKAGFTIEHEWQPEKRDAVFIIGKKQ